MPGVAQSSTASNIYKAHRKKMAREWYLNKNNITFKQKTIAEAMIKDISAPTDGRIVWRKKHVSFVKKEVLRVRVPAGKVTNLTRLWWTITRL
jgi:hypothetical protein